MSGGIHISDGNFWGAAGWCYRAMSDEIIRVLVESDRCPPLLDYLRDPHGSAEIIEYINLASRSPEEINAFREAAAVALERLRRTSAQEWAYPEMLPQFLEHCQTLLAQLEKAARGCDT